MRIARAVLLLVSLVPLNAVAQTYALGIGSSSPDSVDLRVDGKPKTFHVAAETPSPATRTFLNCLVAGRVIRIAADGKLMMLDGNEVVSLLHEFTQSKTSIDPCALGKAAYVPAHAANNVVATPPPAPAAKPTPTPTPAAKTTTPPAEPPKKKLGIKPKPPEVPPDDARMKKLGAAFPSREGSTQASAPPPPRSDAPPSVLDGPVTTMKPAPVETMPTASNPAETPKAENPKSGTTTNPQRPPL